VLELRYVSKTEALANAMADMQEFKDVFADLDNNPLPASLEVRMKPGSRTPQAVRAVAERLKAYPFVEDVRYGREWLERIFLIRRLAGGAATLIGVAFALVAAIIIATAVRIAVFARREEISIMRLVGATDGFVQRPFLLEGLMTGVMGGLLAALLTWGAVRQMLFEVSHRDVGTFGVVIGAILLTGVLASGFPAQRVTRQPTASVLTR
jgi:cell division transport system permease protein